MFHYFTRILSTCNGRISIKCNVKYVPIANFYFLVKNSNLVKRGRGRPRKDSLGSNMSQTQSYFLDEGKTYIGVIYIRFTYVDHSYNKQLRTHNHTPTHTLTVGSVFYLLTLLEIKQNIFRLLY